ncbi:MAG: hypothetical protein PHQ96_06970 [Candidatus Omnitrophica bacterium]|nr:hypothetical protein [Candidatus Omnitrophota bacterium]
MNEINKRFGDKIYQEAFCVFSILIICSIIIGIFHFDVFILSDSAWLAITEINLLRHGLLSLRTLFVHGVPYLYGYYIINYAILHIIPHSALSIMHILNLINGLFSACNIALIYLLLRNISFSKFLSFFLALLYFFIPMIFQLSLFANPNTFSLFFFLLSNFFFVSYLNTNRPINLAFSSLFLLLSVFNRIDTIIYYSSFIALAVLLKKSVTKSLRALILNAVFSLAIVLVVQKLLLGYSDENNLLYCAVSFYKECSVKFFMVFMLKTLCAVGFGLIGICIILLIYEKHHKNIRLLYATALWLTPVFLHYFIFPQLAPRHIIISFIWFIILIGVSLRRLSKKMQVFLLLLIYVIHFGSMGIPYQLVKKYYPLKRHYKNNERIVIADFPLGNIFVSSYFLREENRRVWQTAKKVVINFDKVIILGDNTYRMPYYFFLYAIYDINMDYLKNATSHWKAKGKEFIFIDVLPKSDMAIIREFLRDSKYSNFSIHFPPFIPERAPALYKDIEQICTSTNRVIIK